MTHFVNLHHVPSYNLRVIVCLIVNRMRSLDKYEISLIYIENA